MKYVRLENNIVREIIPDEATVPSVAHWYGEDFAALCRKAPDEVCQGWVYDPDADTYAPAPESPASPVDEIGQQITELQLAVIEMYEMLMGGGGAGG